MSMIGKRAAAYLGTVAMAQYVIAAPIAAANGDPEVPAPPIGALVTSGDTGVIMNNITDETIVIPHPVRPVPSPYKKTGRY
jgi:hypothetical protein